MTINITLFRNAIFVAYDKTQPMFDGQGCWVNEEVKAGQLTPPNLIIFGYKNDTITFEETADIVREVIGLRKVGSNGVRGQDREPCTMTDKARFSALKQLHKAYPFGFHFIYEGQAYKATRLSSLSAKAKRFGCIEFNRLHGTDVVSFGVADAEMTRSLNTLRFTPIANEPKARATFSQTFAKMFSKAVADPLGPNPNVVIFNMGDLNKQGYFQL